MRLNQRESALDCHPIFTSGLSLSTPNAENISPRVSGVERESRQPPFWPAEEPTEFVVLVQELPELEKENYEGFFIPMMGNLILYLIKTAIGLLILFLLFEYLIGPILIDIMFSRCWDTLPGADCS